MNKYGTPINILLILTVKVQAQTNSIIGEYYLKNAKEMAAGLNFNPAAIFEFF